MAEELVALAVLLGFTFGWNNGSLLFGNLRGSGATSVKTAVAILIAGLVLGVVLEGPKMYSGLAGSLARTTNDSVLFATLATAVAFTLVLTILSLPVSISMVMVASFLGSTYSSAFPVNWVRSSEVVAFWFVAPLIAALATYFWARQHFGNAAGVLAIALFTMLPPVASTKWFFFRYTILRRRESSLSACLSSRAWLDRSPSSRTSSRSRKVF